MGRNAYRRDIREAYALALMMEIRTPEGLASGRTISYKRTRWCGFCMGRLGFPLVANIR